MHRLALALGKTVGELERTMSVREFRDWHLFEQVQPLPDLLSDLQNALLCVVACNIMRGSDSTPAEVNDFRILRDPDEARPRVEPEVSEAEQFKRTLRGF